jgi:hypothetical protein
MGANRHFGGVRDGLAGRHVEPAVVLRALDLVTIHEPLREVRPAVSAERIDCEIGIPLRPHDRQLAALDLNFDDVTALDLVGAQDVLPSVLRHDTDRGIIAV